MVKQFALHPRLLALVMIAVVLSAAGCTSATPEADSPYRGEPPVPPRSSVVSDSAGPEEVTKAFILALSEDRPGDANALWGGPVKVFTSGLKYLEGSSHLVLSSAKTVKELPPTPTSPRMKTPVQDTPEFRERYAGFASVDGTLTPAPGAQTPNPPDAFVFRIGLGRLPGGRWEVLTTSMAGVHLR